ncbi:hypothetical protein IMG5_127630, partial [Ichthyophthirius multifiliis]
QHQEIIQQLQSELNQVYGKNAYKIANLSYNYEIIGHKEGVITGKYSLMNQSLKEHEYGQILNPSNQQWLNELQNTTYLNIDEKNINLNVVEENSHFSLILDDFKQDEYVQELDDNQVIVFNFPVNWDKNDILNFISSEINVPFQSISVTECVISLPAFATLTFNNQKDALTFKNLVNTKQYKSDLRHPLQACTFEDSRNEHSLNRTLVIQGFFPDQKLTDLLFELSSYGRVVNLEFIEEPQHQALPTSQQVLDYLKKNVDETNTQFVYEINDLSQDIPKVIEYPPYNPIFNLKDKKKEEIQRQWIEQQKFYFENKILLANQKIIKKKKYTEEGGEEEPAQEKEEEKEKGDQYYQPLTDIEIKYKNIKYEKYLQELQNLYDGDYTEEMRENIFGEKSKQSCKDVDGQIFLNQEKSDFYNRIVLSDQQIEDKKYFEENKHLLPTYGIEQVLQGLKENPEGTMRLIQEFQVPDEVYDIKKEQLVDKEGKQVPLQNYVQDLNNYIAQLGEKFEAQKDSYGDDKIMKFINKPYKVPIKILNIDEKNSIRNILKGYGLQDDQIEKEIAYFVEHGDYSSYIYKHFDKSQKQLDFDDLQFLIESTGLSQAGIF